LAAKGARIVGEMLARVSPEKGVELIDERSVKLEGVGSMTPEDAAYLARGMLALAVPCPVQILPRSAHLVVTHICRL